MAAEPATSGWGESLACVVPAYQAATTLGSVIHQVRVACQRATSETAGRAPLLHLVVVDDGSTDATGSVAHAYADEVIAFPRNRGKGAALRAGFASAVRRGMDAVVTIDADGQHDGADVPRLLGALQTADLVIGVRERRGSAMPWIRRVSNAASAAAASACARRAWRDSQCGLRAFRTSILSRIRARGDRYEYETDFLIEAARAEVRIACVDIPTVYGGESHFRPIRDGCRIVGTLARAALRDARGVPHTHV